MKDQIFVSYSRDQLYFAESVAHTLQEQKFNLWLDLQQLEPGAAWLDEVKSGLIESSRIILVASRSSLQSPYVATEWLHALKRRKPIYIVLFEEVEFKTFTTTCKGETMVVPLEELRVKAKAIVDGRGNFKEAMKRLKESLVSAAIHKDPIPAANRLKIPQRLPFPVAFIAGTMLALTLIMLALTLTVFTAFPPMMLVGCIAAGYCGLQTWEFLQRKSYQGTRVTLTVAPGIVFLFAFWFTPIALAALYFAMYSEDVHRWSPRGEGNNPRDLVLKRKKPLWLQVLPFLFLVPLFFWQPGILWLVLILWFFVRNRNFYETHRRGDTAIVLLILSTLLIVIDPILALPIVLTIAFIANRRQKPLPRTDSMVNVTYVLHAQPEDTHIAQDINNALEYAGLKRLHSSQRVTPPHYHIVLVSNFGCPPKIENLKAKGGKIVVVVASSLSDWKRVEAYSDYQWVDYRRQDPERLIAMARDLKAGETSNSFNTRIVPQSFERLVIPARVFLFTLVQLFFYTFIIFRVTRAIVTGSDINWVLLAYSALSLVVGFWVVGRILERRITILRMTQINVVLAFFLNILILVTDLVRPVPQGSERNTQEVLIGLVISVIFMFIAYRVGLFQMKTILNWWLPLFVSPGKSRPKNGLSQAIFASGLVTIVLTVSFFGPNIPVSHDRLPPDRIRYERVGVARDLSLDVPAHWLELPTGIRDTEIGPYILNVPLSAVLLEANGPSNRTLALAMNRYFQSPFAAETLSLAIIHLLGRRIEHTFDLIAFSLDPDSYSWRPEYYGSPLYTAAYVPDWEAGDILILTVWLFGTDTAFVPSVHEVVTNARFATNTQEIPQNILSPDLAQQNREIAVMQLKASPTRTVVVMSLETSGPDYFVTVNGSARLLQENTLILEHVLGSLNVSDVIVGNR